MTIEYLDFFYEKYNQQELWLQYCPHCHTSVFYPRAYCPGCLQGDMEWRKASGRATLTTYTVVHASALSEFEEVVPYVYALVDLEEGVRIASNIVGCPIDSIEIEMPLQIAWIERNSRNLAVFKPSFF